MTRRRFTERETLETAVQQGAIIPCYRCGVPFTVETVRKAQREHLHEVTLGGPDTVGNCRYSHDECHSLITNGTKATTAGSSKHRAAKANNHNRTEKFVVRKPAPGEPRIKASGRHWPTRPMQSGKRQWPKRKIDGTAERRT